MMNDLDGFLEYIRINRVTRADAEQLIGRDDVARLLAEAIISDNPFTGRLELRRPTEDFYP